MSFSYVFLICYSIFWILILLYIVFRIRITFSHLEKNQVFVEIIYKHHSEEVKRRGWVDKNDWFSLENFRNGDFTSTDRKIKMLDNNEVFIISLTNILRANKSLNFSLGFIKFLNRAFKKFD